ncbi:MAG: septum formation initiator family protein [Treponema sp.]|nr:septum formation initiator family protein [Treponema sp.]
MRVSKYLIGIWVAIAVYAVFSFLGGPKGLSAYNYLLSEREHQRENIQNLGTLNEELEKTQNSLLFDYETLQVKARQMGYGQENERFIRIVGLNNQKSNPSASGYIYTAQNPEFIPDLNIKIAALIAGSLVFVFLFMMEIIEKRSR